MSRVIEEPKTVGEALSGGEARNWNAAMKEELNALKRNETWELVERPKDGNVIGSKWVYKLKTDMCGEVERYKSRLVAQGFNQIKNVNFSDTYSLVMKAKTVRVLFAIAVEMGWEMHHPDIVSAYLNGTLKETVYMEQPPNFDDLEKPRCQYVCRLRKTLYGLQQSGKEWNYCIDQFLKQLGSHDCISEPCVYVKKGLRDGKTGLIIGLFVDDLIVTGKPCEILEFKR